MQAFIRQIQAISTPEQASELLAEHIELSPTIHHAITIATNAHTNQFRKSGEPYIIHPILVACIVANIVCEEAMVIAALLHDVVEDTATTIEELETDFVKM